VNNYYDGRSVVFLLFFLPSDLLAEKDFPPSLFPSIFNNCGGIRNILTKERFLRYFEDPRREANGKHGNALNITMGASTTHLIKSPNNRTTTDVNTVNDGIINQESLVSSSIFISALSTIVRNKKHLIVSLENSVQRRRSMSRENRLKMVQLSRSRRSGYSNKGSSNSSGSSSQRHEHRYQKLASTTMNAKNVFHSMNGHSDKQKLEWLKLTRINAPNQDELEAILKSTPYNLTLTRKEWDTLLMMGVVNGSVRGSSQHSSQHYQFNKPIGLETIDCHYFLDNVTRTLKAYSGNVAFNGNKMCLKEKARQRRRMKEMNMRTKAPFSNRRF
jgi:hypothetical protein